LFLRNNTKKQADIFSEYRRCYRNNGKDKKARTNFRMIQGTSSFKQRSFPLRRILS
jgi:hypothetical protein